MPHYFPGTNLFPRTNLATNVIRYFSKFEAIWVLTRHSGYIYIKARKADGNEEIFKCDINIIDNYFTEDKMSPAQPPWSGRLSEVRTFPYDVL